MTWFFCLPGVTWRGRIGAFKWQCARTHRRHHWCDCTIVGLLSDQQQTMAQFSPSQFTHSISIKSNKYLLILLLFFGETASRIWHELWRQFAVAWTSFVSSESECLDRALKWTNMHKKLLFVWQFSLLWKIHEIVSSSMKSWCKSNKSQAALRDAKRVGSFVYQRTCVVQAFLDANSIFCYRCTTSYVYIHIYLRFNVFWLLTVIASSS